MIVQLEEGAAWPEVERWRGQQRGRLLKARQSIDEDERGRLGAAVLDRVGEAFPGLSSARIGFYWPFKGEIDARGFVGGLVERGADAALPVVVEKDRPLEFWRWRPGAALQRGVLGIPIPESREPITPSAVLVPLIGYDEAGYRLGYGGGYYDRTLAALSEKPFAIGIGFTIGRLETIHPQPHDIPMDAIVTERGLIRTSEREL